MHILITNDDGYSSVGIHALAEVVHNLGWRATIVAPSSHMSGASRSRRSGVPLTWTRSQHIVSFPVFHVEGTPAACVVFGLTSGLFEPFDLCISGINAGENLGASLSISGTFGAALEAASYDVRGIAISRQYESFHTEPERWDWSRVGGAALAALRSLMDCKENWRVANINLPNKINGSQPMFTKISNLSYYNDRYDESQGCIVSSIDYPTKKLERGDDIHAFAELSLTSITLLAGKII